VLFRRALGDPAARFQPTAIALDRSGSILLAGLALDASLPTLRALQPRHGGAADVYLWQLSPDATSTTFASYLGGRDQEQPLSVAFDPTGQAVLALNTPSPDFPFTAVDGPATLPANVPRLAVVRFSPATGRVSYAVGLPVGPFPYLSFGSDGTVYLPSLEPTTGQVTIQPPPSILREILPDGVRRVRPLPLPLGTVPFRLLPSPDGGYWLAGQAFGDILPTTPGALQPQAAGFTYQRWERDQIITPPGPIRSLSVRQLAVDRADENRIYAATLRGLARADDNGWTWEIVNDTLPLRNVLSLVAGRGRLWAIAGGSARPELHTSVDAGVTWTAAPLPALPPGTAAGLLTAHPTEPDTLFLAAGSTLISTRDAGQSWTLRNLSVNEGISAIAVDERAVAVQITLPGGRFTPGTHTLIWSDDGGSSFPRRLPLGQTAQTLRFDPNEPGRLYTSDFTRFARTSAETFPELEVLSPVDAARPPLAQFAFQTGAPGAIYGVFVDRRLAQSEDGGRTWRAVSAPPSSTGPIDQPTQLHVAAGGVVHLGFPPIPESFLGKFTSAGEPVYLTYLGGRGAVNFALLTRTAAGLIVASGLTFGDFPGERLGGETRPFPPGVTPPVVPGLFAIAFQEDTSLVYSAVLSSSSGVNLLWSGPGAGSNIVFLGTTSAPDFPGLTPGAPAAGPTLFLSRVRP
jgi:photosystem II stability/assembly factor-like uncharacterized protein